MPATMTLLRYPGGKTKLYDFVLEIIEKNDLSGCNYIEPFAGGCGLALKLLLKGNVSNIVLNDFDIAIYSFWYSVFNYTDDLCRLIEITPITLDEREKHIDVLKNKNEHSTFEIGFATFFLNRTNISGILKGGPIGGIEQNGKYKLDARFNKKTLLEKVYNIAKYKDSVRLTNLDVHDFIDNVLPNYQVENTFINFDPPYVKKGPSLYLNAFCSQDHMDLSNKISTCNHKWIITYDQCSLISELYKSYRQDLIRLKYSAGDNKEGTEIVIYSNTLK